MKRALAIVALLLGVAFVMPVDNASARGWSQVCHNGFSTNPPVEVYEVGGATYLVYPGECTPADVDIRGVRPMRGTSMFFTQEGSSKTYRKSGIPPVGQMINWWTTLGQDINVYKTRYGS